MKIYAIVLCILNYIICDFLKMLWKADVYCYFFASIIADADICKICFEDDKKVECAFVKCGHMLTCLSCAGRLKQCPVCRSDVEQILKLYKP